MRSASYAPPVISFSMKRTSVPRGVRVILSVEAVLRTHVMTNVSAVKRFVGKSNATFWSLSNSIRELLHMGLNLEIRTGTEDVSSVQAANNPWWVSIHWLKNHQLIQM